MEHERSQTNDRGSKTKCNTGQETFKLKQETNTAWDIQTWQRKNKQRHNWLQRHRGTKQMETDWEKTMKTTIRKPQWTDAVRLKFSLINLFPWKKQQHTRNIQLQLQAEEPRSLSIEPKLGLMILWWFPMFSQSECLGFTCYFMSVFVYIIIL